MKKLFFILVLLFSGGIAFGNPIVVDPFGSISSIIVVGGSLLVEACVVALVLLFFGMLIKPLFVGLLFGNLVVYFVLFLPVLEALPSVWMAEVLIVAADGVVIKVLSQCEMFQDTNFKELKWRYALLIGMLGNTLSYYVGAVMNG